VNFLEFRRVSFGQISRYFVGRCKMNFLETSNIKFNINRFVFNINSHLNNSAFLACVAIPLR
jgi:hypothetical protein